MLKHGTEVFSQAEPRGDAEKERGIMQHLIMCQNIPDMMNLTPYRKTHMLIFIRWTGFRFAQHPHTHTHTHTHSVPLLENLLTMIKSHQSNTFLDADFTGEPSAGSQQPDVSSVVETLQKGTALQLQLPNSPTHITKPNIHTDNAGSQETTQSYL